MPTDLDDRLTRVERRSRIASIVAVAGVTIGTIGLLTGTGGGSVAVAAAPADGKLIQRLRVRELDVVDGAGVTRVTLAAPLPMPIVDGKRLTRGGGPDDTMSGMLLFDATGGERSGYATVDKGYSNVLFTLDEPGGKQHALFIAEPNGSATLRLFNAATKDRVDLAIGSDGPSLSLVRGGKEVYRQPADRAFDRTAGRGRE